MKGIDTLFENEHILVFNKPAGLPVQGGAGVGVSLDSLLAQNYKTRPFLVHRLDKDTSGIIVTAKTKESAALCSQLFSDHHRGLKKNYLAVCAGIPDKKGTINEKLLIKGRELEAETSYSRKGFLELPGLKGKAGDYNGISLIEVTLTTGRMHQIRRHLAGRGNPVLGDDKYGDFTLNKLVKKTWGVKHLLLHASSIYIPDPLVKGGMEIHAPLPDYVRDLTEKISRA
jgi:23S rRNA pseudouridine955/2504/2580 synthase